MAGEIYHPEHPPRYANNSDLITLHLLMCLFDIKLKAIGYFGRWFLKFSFDILFLLKDKLTKNRKNEEIWFSFIKLILKGIIVEAYNFHWT